MVVLQRNGARDVGPLGLNDNIAIILEGDLNRIGVNGDRLIILSYRIDILVALREESKDILNVGGELVGNSTLLHIETRLSAGESGCNERRIIYSHSERSSTSLFEIHCRNIPMLTAIIRIEVNVSCTAIETAESSAIFIYNRSNGITIFRNNVIADVSSIIFRSEDIITGLDRDLNFRVTIVST